MKERLHWLLGLTLLVLLMSCIDEITLDLDTEERFLIVGAQLSDQPDTYDITLNQSPIIGVGTDNILDPVIGAMVFLEDDLGNTIGFIENDTFPGTYSAYLELETDRQYRLNLILSDGIIIESTPERIPESKAIITELDFDVMEVELINESGNVGVQEFVELYVNNAPFAERTYSRWRVEGEYQFIEKYPRALNPRNCYIKDNVDLNNVRIANSEDFQNGEIIDYPILRTVFNDRFNIVYLFNVYQHVISRQEFEYWQNIQQLINIDGTLFDPPPGAVRNNLQNMTNPDSPVQGYFSISSLTFERFFAVPSRKGFFIDTECTSNPFRFNPEKCADCTTISKSSLVRPPYWVY